MPTVLTGGKITLRDIESSQYVSALLLCAPYTPKGMDLTLQGGVVSTPYIDLTIAVMNDFGAKIIQTGKYEYHVTAGKIYQGREYCVEGDASSASYFFLAAALLRKTIRVSGINRQSKQGDIRLLSVLEELGCSDETRHQKRQNRTASTGHLDFLQYFEHLSIGPCHGPTLSCLEYADRASSPNAHTSTGVPQHRIRL